MRFPKRVKREDTKFCILPRRCDECEELIVFEWMTLVSERIISSVNGSKRYKSIYRCQHCMVLYNA